MLFLASCGRDESKTFPALERAPLDESPNLVKGFDPDVDFRTPDKQAAYVEWLDSHIADLVASPRLAPTSLGNAHRLRDDLVRLEESFINIDMVPVLGTYWPLEAGRYEVAFSWFNLARDTRRLHVLLEHNDGLSYLVIDRQLEYLDEEQRGLLVVTLVLSDINSKDARSEGVVKCPEDAGCEVRTSGGVPIAFAIEDSLGNVSGFVEVVDLERVPAQEE
jgi:hypothetical protein